MQFKDSGYEGFDVSFYQDNDTTPQTIDFGKMKMWGADFVIVRAGQNEWIDPDFSVNWRNAKAAGLPRGSYWFYDPRISPTRQADLYMSLFASDPPEGRLWVDFEFPASWGGAYTHWTHWRAFMEAVRAKYRTGIYTANWWWKPNAEDKGADTAYFGQFPLWVAGYTADPFYVTLPKGWTQAHLWQDGTPAIGPIVGVESQEIDHNKWNGNFDFNAEWGASAPPPPTGGTMEEYKVVTAGLKIRTAPPIGSVLGPDAGKVMTRDDLIHVSVKDTASGWLKIEKWIKAAGGDVYPPAGIQWWCSGASSYVQFIQVITEPPPPDPEPGVTITGVHYSGEVVFDYSDGRQEVWHISDAPLVKGPAQ